VCLWYIAVKGAIQNFKLSSKLQRTEQLPVADAISCPATGYLQAILNLYTTTSSTVFWHYTNFVPENITSQGCKTYIWVMQGKLISQRRLWRSWTAGRHWSLLPSQGKCFSVKKEVRLNKKIHVLVLHQRPYPNQCPHLKIAWYQTTNTPSTWKMMVNHQN